MDYVLEVVSAAAIADFPISLAPSGSAGTGWGSGGAAAGTIGNRRGDGAALDLSERWGRAVVVPC